MKHKYMPLVALVATALIAVPAFAETSNSKDKNKIEDRNPKVNASSTDKIDKAEQNKEENNKIENNNRKIENNARVLNNKVRSDVKVFTATANRLDKIIARIESRVAKIKALGGDTAQVEASLATGKSKLADARVDITAISSIDLTSATSTTTIRVLLGSIKTIAVKTKTDLKASHVALVKATTLLQGADKKVKVKDDDIGENETSSSTASTTNKRDR